MFATPYQEVIYKSRYAKWVEEGRREDWPETVRRLTDYYTDHVFKTGRDVGLDLAVVGDELYQAIHDLDVMPSMRALMTAGPALDRCHVPAYNCAYLPVDSPRSFDEAMYILMCGTGVGFSVEDQYVRQLPRISESFSDTDTVIRVADSKEGWAKSLRELISLLIAGQVPRWDVTAVRAAGARLVTFGGRASGPGPLVDLFEFAIRVFQGAAGRRLTSLECHDLMCKVGDVVVVGGVRRSAMISLSDVNDDKMRVAKSGEWWDKTGYRRLANNSAVYNDKPDTSLFLKEWTSLYESKSGERGFFSRAACQNVAERNGRRDATYEFGTNPCSEIILRPYQFCNLTEIVVRADDGVESLIRKARIAAILGTIQSTFTDFKYLRKIWRTNCEEERLLGVSLTGVCDNLGVLGDASTLNRLREVVVDTNRDWAARLGIAQSAATTCVKPSGTVSQLVDSASGLHSRYSPYYLRTIRADNKDPVTAFLQDAGVYCEPDRTSGSTSVFYFPVKSPDGAVTRHDRTALEELETWKLFQDEWCEHKPSVTISVKEDEWMEVGAWVLKNFDSLSGVSFLPYDGGQYVQAPYQEMTKRQYDAFIVEHPTPVIDWSKLTDYEKEDHTTGSQELACTGGSCDIAMIGAI